jgi:lauroyl/myristoyl acyltransferase
MGYKVHTVALDHPSEQVTDFYDQRRREVGVMAYPVADSFPVLKEALEQGEVVALLTDRSYGRAKRRHKFFGLEVDLPIGYLVLAIRCKVPVLTGAILLDASDRFKYVHGGVYYPPEGMDEAGQIAALQEKCVADFERIIEQYSEQWFHFRSLEENQG